MAAGPVEPDLERRSRATQHDCPLGCIQTFPSRDAQYLALRLGQMSERGVEGLLPPHRLGMVGRTGSWQE
jgi:hypothetical protein